jgi:hypothetical protein
MCMIIKWMESRLIKSSSLHGSIADGRDMIATLGSFAIAPLWSLRRLGIHLTDEEELAYVSVWRHIG